MDGADIAATDAPVGARGVARRLRLRRRRNEMAPPEHVARHVAVPVHPSDGLVIARMLAIAVLACVFFVIDEGAVSEQTGFALLFYAWFQPLLAVFWPRQESFLQAQMLADVFFFGVVAWSSPQYFWLGIIVLASVVANYAVMTSLRRYVPVAVAGAVCESCFG